MFDNYSSMTAFELGTAKHRLEQLIAYEQSHPTSQTVTVVHVAQLELNRVNSIIADRRTATSIFANNIAGMI